MSLKLMYITNDPAVALLAEKHGVDRVMIDLETLGKDERQRNMNTVKSHHSVRDITRVSQWLVKAETLVRVNPWNENSPKEIDAVIKAGADRIMLPMWKTVQQVDCFLQAVGGRARTTLLLETKEAVQILDQVLEHPQLEEIHIGLNDLHLSYGMTFLFEPLANGMVDSLCAKCKAKGIPYGFGGIARLGEGILPAELIVMEHYRLGSSMTILSRSFCDARKIRDIREVERIFAADMALLRQYEESMSGTAPEKMAENTREVKVRVDQIVRTIKGRREK